MAAKKRKKPQPQRGQHGTPPATSHPSPPRPAFAPLILAEYEITDAPLEDHALTQLPAQVRHLLDNLADTVHYAPTEAIQTLESLVATYPHLPLFANHLGSAYLHVGDKEKAHIPSDLVVDRWASYPEGNSVLDFPLRSCTRPLRIIVLP